MPREGVILDAEPLPGALRLTLAPPRGGLEEALVEAEYTIHLLPLGSWDARRMARALSDSGLDARVEEWRRPPWYDSTVEVVAASHPDPGLLDRVARAAEARGAARRVNTYPGHRLRALWRLPAPPGAPVSIGAGRVEPLPGEPRVLAARLEAWSWHGPLLPGEEPRYYTVDCGGGPERARDAWEALEALHACRPSIVEARAPARATLPPAPRPWLWLDPERSLVTPRGLLEWMRASWLPYRAAHDAPIGRVLTATLAREAGERRMLLDPMAPRREPFRPLRSLAHSDMPGAARIPEPGLYWRVTQIDYSSLYPTLIALHNVSAETVDKPRCRARGNPAPGYTSHTVCMDEPGLAATVLARLVERRAQAKARGRLEEAEALKWMLVSGFGYLGYRNSLFGSIQAYETVTALARAALARAEEAAERLGYRVVHAIVDSVFIQPTDPKAPPEEVAREITRATGVPARIEAEYDWLYIPPTLRGTGAANKYYGRLRDGRVKTRGILAARRDTPPIIRGAQHSAIQALARARNPNQWPAATREAARRIQWYKRIIESREAHPRSLVIERKPAPGERSTPARRAARRAGTQGPTRYIETPAGPWPVQRGPPPAYSKHHYLRLLQWAARELPPPHQHPPPPGNPSSMDPR